MRRLFRGASAVLAVSLAVVPAVPAAASPLSERQWWVDSWAVEKLVWPKTEGEGVTVAVIDSGVNARLPDMRPAVVPGRSFQGGQSPKGMRDTEEGFGHGTAMASLIASRGVETGFTGIAPKSKVMPLVAPNVGTSTTVPAVRYAVDHGAKVISISQGAEAGNHDHHCPPKMLEAIAYAAKKDVIVVASAGNHGDTSNEPMYPGSCPGVVAVGAMDNRGEAWEKTQRQDYVTLSAPGVDIPALSQDGRVWPNGAGTSHAAALAAGAFALLRSEFPQKSARQIVQLAVNTAKDFGPSGKDKMHGYGTLSLRTALSEQVPSGAPSPVYDRLDKVLAQTQPEKGTETEPVAVEDSTGISPLILVIGGVLVAGLAVLVFFLFMRRGKGPRPQTPAGSPPPPGYGQGGGPFAPGAPPPPGPGMVPPHGMAPPQQPPAPGSTPRTPPQTPPQGPPQAPPPGPQDGMPPRS